MNDALAVAVRKGQLESVRAILDSGVEPDARNFYGDSLIDMARDRGHTAVAALLEDACSRRTLCSRDVRGRTIKHRTECAAALLDAGGTISAKDADYGSTPLAWAARNNLSDMVEFLLARGASLNLPDDEPWATPLAWAERRGLGEIVSILRRHGTR